VCRTPVLAATAVREASTRKPSNREDWLGYRGQHMEKRRGRGSQQRHNMARIARYPLPNLIYVNRCHPYSSAVTQREHLRAKTLNWRMNPSLPIIPNNRVPHHKLRRILFARDIRCEKCGITDHLEIHHIEPIRHGGSNEPMNLQVLCAKHHAEVDLIRAKFQKKGQDIRALLHSTEI